jgi:radical SAM-linked protein
MDVMLTEAVSPEEFVTRVRPALPEGLSLVDAREVPLKSPSLQSALRRAEYRVTVETSLPGDELSSRINHLLDCDRLEQQRVRKRRVETFDLRPLVDELRLEAIGQGHAVLWMRLSAGQRGNARPDAILAALGLEDAYSQVERTKLLFEFDSK